MEYRQEEYTKFYIIQALFKLMAEYEYEKINVTDIVNKAGVGRATFYRNFKRKEDIIIYYFKHHTSEFMFNNRFYPRCREDYIKIVTNALTVFKQQMQVLKLLRKAHLEYVYLDYLNENMSAMFESEYPDSSKYKPYCYSGLLFNVSMAWLDNDCADPISALAELIVDAIYFGN